MRRDVARTIATLICRQEKGGCGKSITVIDDSSAGFYGQPLKRMKAIHSDELNGHVLAEPSTVCLVYKLRGALEDRCASSREGAQINENLSNRRGDYRDGIDRPNQRIHAG